MLLLSGCAAGNVRLANPDPARADPITLPMVPAGEAICEDAPCLSDRQTAELLADYAAALDAANGRLLWLQDWIVRASKPVRRR